MGMEGVERRENVMYKLKSPGSSSCIKCQHPRQTTGSSDSSAFLEIGCTGLHKGSKTDGWGWILTNTYYTAHTQGSHLFVSRQILMAKLPQRCPCALLNAKGMEALRAVTQLRLCARKTQNQNLHPTLSPSQDHISMICSMYMHTTS